MWFVSSPGPRTQWGADKDEGRVCPQSQVVCKPASGWGSWWGSRAEAQGKSKPSCSLAACRALVEATQSLGAATVPPLYHHQFLFLQLQSPCDFTQGKACLSWWIASYPCLAMLVPLVQPTHASMYTGRPAKVGPCAVTLT